MGSIQYNFLNFNPISGSPDQKFKNLKSKNRADCCVKYYSMFFQIHVLHSNGANTILSSEL